MPPGAATVSSATAWVTVPDGGGRVGEVVVEARPEQLGSGLGVGFAVGGVAVADGDRRVGRIGAFVFGDEAEDGAELVAQVGVGAGLACVG